MQQCLSSTFCILDNYQEELGRGEGGGTLGRDTVDWTLFLAWSLVDLGQLAFSASLFLPGAY